MAVYLNCHILYTAQQHNFVFHTLFSLFLPFDNINTINNAF